MTKIPVTVNFSRESPYRAGWIDYSIRGDTIVVRQSLARTEQWESDAEQVVFIPKEVLKQIAEKLG